MNLPHFVEKGKKYLSGRFSFNFRLTVFQRFSSRVNLLNEMSLVLGHETFRYFFNRDDVTRANN